MCCAMAYRNQLVRKKISRRSDRKRRDREIFSHMVKSVFLQADYVVHIFVDNWAKGPDPSVQGAVGLVQDIGGFG